MTDPMTDLASEFLYLNKYHVSTEVKFYKNKEQKGTKGDIDIIARRVKNLKLDDLTLGKNLVAEVKSQIIKRKTAFDNIYSDKFAYIDDLDIGWSQLKDYVPNKNFERILFCLATTEEVYEYALKKYNLRILTFGFIFKELNKLYQETGQRTYIPGASFFSMTRWLSWYLFKSHLYQDKLTLEDFIWIDPDDEPRYTKEFNRLNSDFMSRLLWFDDDALRKMLLREPSWFLKQIIDQIKENKIKGKEKKEIIDMLKKESSKL